MPNLPFFSIIICTYNPDFSIFSRVLKSIHELKTDGINYEIIIVDNNSSESLVEHPAVISFLSGNRFARVISEKSPGLTSARIAGIENSLADWIIFFDDDNEPDTNYLLEAKKLIGIHPELGICGPGVIKVKFSKENSLTVTQRIQELFQSRCNHADNISDNLHLGNPQAFPYGTGMIVKKDIADKYATLVHKNIYTLNDRIGNSFLSGGDTQILYLAMLRGYHSGTGHRIQLNHIISPEKISIHALIKLIYSLQVCHIKAYNEVFEKKLLFNSPKSNYELLKLILSNLFRGRNKNRTDRLFDLSASLGMEKAAVVAGNLKSAYLLRLWERYWKIA